ncbi:MAG: rRNA maturation RNase YbeY [Enterobacteriaceae bacterium]
MIFKKKKIVNFLIIIKNVVTKFKKKTKIIIKLVNKKKILKYNLIYRGINKYTNILSFKFDNIYNIKGYIGDLIIYNKTKTLINEKNFLLIIHLIIHGVFHLLNLNHFNIYEKKQMEILEIEVLNHLGFKNPYYLIN